MCVWSNCTRNSSHLRTKQALLDKNRCKAQQPAKVCTNHHLLRQRKKRDEKAKTKEGREGKRAENRSATNHKYHWDLWSPIVTTWLYCRAGIQWTVNKPSLFVCTHGSQERSPIFITLNVETLYWCSAKHMNLYSTERKRLPINKNSYQEIHCLNIVCA